MLNFDREKYLSPLFNFVLFAKLRNILCRSYVPLFLEFINIVSFLFYNFIEFIILLHTFLVTSFSRYKEDMSCLNSFSKFSDALSAFTCASAIDNI